MDVYVCLVISVLIPLTIAQTMVNKCPLQQKTWKSRERILDCNEKEGLYYHCIRTIDDKLVEICLSRRSVSAEAGCPYINTSHNNKFFFAPCHDRPGCPRRSSVYDSNELYKYPGCIMPSTGQRSTVSATDINNVPQNKNITQRYHRSTTMTFQASRTISEAFGECTCEEPVSFHIFLGIVAGSSTVILALIIAVILLFVRLRRSGIIYHRPGHSKETQVLQQISVSATQPEYSYHEIAETARVSDNSSSASYIEPNPVQKTAVQTVKYDYAYSLAGTQATTSLHKENILAGQNKPYTALEYRQVAAKWRRRSSI